MTVSTNTATTVAVDAAALKAALAKIKPAMDGRAYNPVLHCIRVDATSSGVRLTATDLDDTLSTTIEGIVTEPGSVLVPFKLLNKLLLVHKKGTVEIIGAAGDIEPTVRCKNLTLPFEALDVNEFPGSTRVPAGPSSSTWRPSPTSPRRSARTTAARSCVRCWCATVATSPPTPTGCTWWTRPMTPAKASC
jgi:hypothetical protein